jgi:hypothetical protein
MSHFLNFCSTFLFFVANLIGGHRDHLLIMYLWHMSSCLLKPKKCYPMEMESNFTGPLCALQIWKHIHWAFRYMHRQNMCWTLSEHLWVCMNANEWVGTAPEHPFSANECQWVSGSSPWSPIECAWMPISEYWTPPEHPFSANECQWVSGSSPWSPIECTWMPISEYWTSLEHPWSAYECQWVGVNTHWVHMNAIESLLNATHHGVTMRKFSFVSELNTPWTLVSVHECLWVSIEQPLNTCERA